ncbi:MAG: hypothetical protein OXG70_01300, partial [Cyanobacteria bacterium MAG IRC1_bin_28]|nr:hypothetical protein [Cyanobacteria bacterium MAG IRC1_bin_28]
MLPSSQQQPSKDPGRGFLRRQLVRIPTLGGYEKQRRETEEKIIKKLKERQKTKAIMETIVDKIEDVKKFDVDKLLRNIVQDFVTKDKEQVKRNLTEEVEQLKQEINTILEKIKTEARKKAEDNLNEVKNKSKEKLKDIENKAKDTLSEVKNKSKEVEDNYDELRTKITVTIGLAIAIVSIVSLVLGPFLQDIQSIDVLREDIKDLKQGRG